VTGRIVVVSNDFPPRQGGIETFVRSLCDQLPAERLVVLTATMPGDAAYDADLPFPVERDRTSMLLPSPRVTRHAVRVMRRYGADRVMFGAAAPLGLMGPALRKAGAHRIVALTHGHEAWWARLPGARQALRRIGDAADTVTSVSSWSSERIVPALSAGAAARMRRLTPGVDTSRFHPDCGGEKLRKGLGLDGVPVVACVSRLVPRKGHDMLIRAWPRVLAVVPDAVLLLVGGGPDRERLARLVRDAGVAHAVHFTGAVPWSDIPPYVDAADVFAMPCRTRRFGLEAEALGIVFLEAAAVGKPVVVGDSGGAPGAVRHGETGYLVDPYNPVALSVRLIELLTDPARARALGEAGRAWVTSEWSWDHSGAILRDLLDL
jgi:phosphatidylinositol alpha-1,6-mannosyltransferase